MPILFVHGVGVRDESGFPQIESLLRRFVAPILAPNAPQHVLIKQAFWGDNAAHFAWNRASQQKGRVFGQGGTNESTDNVQQTLLLASVANKVKDAPSSGGSSTVVTTGRTNTTGPLERLSKLSPEQLSDLASSLIDQEPLERFGSTKNKAIALIAADDVAHDPQTFAKFEGKTEQEEVYIFQSLVQNRYDQLIRDESEVIGQGAIQWLQNFAPRTAEVLGRTVDAPGYVVGRLASEFRTPLNTFLTNFTGDVFEYLRRRGDSQNPGRIPLIVLEALKSLRDEAPHTEPLLLLSHSMGGQITYDLVTHFLPNAKDSAKLAPYANLKIDFWCATASQVALFEELKLFLASDPNINETTGKVKFDTPHVDRWWNVWDYNDFVSYTAQDIFSSVDDGAYDSGMFLLQAHGGYLARPSFYRQLARKITAP